MLDGATYNPKWKGDIEKYLEGKLINLDEGFRIVPTESEMKHLRELKTQVQIDNAILTIIDHHYGW